MNEYVENRLIEKIRRLESDLADANEKVSEYTSFVIDENLSYQLVTWKVKKRLEDAYARTNTLCGMDAH